MQKEALSKLKDASPLGGQVFKALLHGRLLAWLGNITQRQILACCYHCILVPALFSV